MATSNEYVVGADIAKLHDGFSIVTAQKIVNILKDGRHLSQIQIVDIKNFERIPYTEQDQILINHIKSFRLDNNTDLVIDGTGVGEALCDQLRSQDITFFQINICASGVTKMTRKTAFDFEIEVGQQVAKELLVSNLKIMIEAERIKVLPDIPYAEELKKQLVHFVGKHTQSGHVVYGNDAAGQFDDLVMAMALIAWHFAKVDEEYMTIRKAPDKDNHFVEACWFASDYENNRRSQNDYDFKDKI